MKRRDFLHRGLITLAAPPILGPTSALAKQRDDSGPPAETRHERVRLLLSGVSGTVLLTGLVMISVSIIWYINMKRSWTRHTLKRGGIGGISFLSELGRATVETRMATAQPFALAFVAGTILYVIADALVRTPPKTTTIINDDNEFTTQFRYRDITAKNPNLISQALALLDEHRKRREREERLYDTFYDEDTGEVFIPVPPHLKIGS